ncbi:MAG: hypothetical protein ACRDOO_26555 [Actinomadura sp.]
MSEPGYLPGMGKRRRRREQRRAEAAATALWQEVTQWGPVQAEWSRAKDAARDAEAKLRRAVEGEREQAASEWQDAQLRLEQAEAALHQEERLSSKETDFDDDMWEERNKEYRRRVRQETFAYWLSGAGLGRKRRHLSWDPEDDDGWWQLHMAQRRYERRAIFVCWLPRAALLVGGAAVIIGAVVVLVND